MEVCIPGACFLPVQEGGLAPLPMSGPFPAAMLWACPESPFPETLSKAISYFTGNFYLPFVNSSLIIFPLKHCLGQSDWWGAGKILTTRLLRGKQTSGPIRRDASREAAEMGLSFLEEDGCLGFADPQPWPCGASSEEERGWG